MNLDRNLNLILTVDRADGSVLYVRATPLSREAFQRYWLLLSRTYAEMTEQGGAWMLQVAPRMAAKMLRRVEGLMAAAPGQRMAAAFSPEAAKTEGVDALLAELRRSALVFVQPKKGSPWDMMPLEDAVSRKLIDEDDVEEVESAIAFFTVCCASIPPREVKDLMSMVFGISGARVESSTPTDLLNSLRTSTQDESIGETVTPSSIPV